MREQGPRIDAGLLGITEDLDTVGLQLGQNAIVRDEAKVALDAVESRRRLPRSGRPGEHRGGATPGHGRGVKQDVAAAEDGSRVHGIDQVDALVEMRAQIARGERLVSEEPHENTGLTLEDQATSTDIADRFLDPPARTREV